MYIHQTPSHLLHIVLLIIRTVTALSVPASSFTALKTTYSMLATSAAFYPPPAVVKIKSCRLNSATNCAGANVPDPYNVIFRGTRCVECIKHDFNEKRRGDDTLKRKLYLSTKQYKLTKKLEQLTQQVLDLSASTASSTQPFGATAHANGNAAANAAANASATAAANIALASRLVKLGQQVQRCQQTLTATNSELDGLRVVRTVPTIVRV